MKKTIKYVVVLIVIIILLTKSFYFEKLDAHQASSRAFDAAGYAGNYWDKKLLPRLDSAVEINTLLNMMKSNKDLTFDTYSHALGIGNIRFFLIKGSGEVTAVGNNDVTVLLKADTGQYTVRIATEYVFGNAVRDASGAIDINEFNNTMDFNNVSAEINKIIREKVLPPFKSRVKKGDIISFTGAVELNREHLDTDNMEIIPVKINFN